MLQFEEQKTAPGPAVGVQSVAPSAEEPAAAENIGPDHPECRDHQNGKPGKPAQSTPPPPRHRAGRER